jgi:hypothetical protein
MGGEEHPEHEGTDAHGEGQAGGARPVRSVSPTVDEDEDHPIRLVTPDRAEASSTTQAADHPTSPETTNAQTEASTAHPADVSAARFISSLFHQRSGSPMGGDAAGSPGPMGTASYFGRTGSERGVNRSSPAPEVGERREAGTAGSLLSGISGTTSVQPQADASTTNDQSSPAQAEEATTPGPRAESSSATTAEASAPNDTQQQPHHPHPVYPTVIPAEHLERMARREAMLRVAEQRQRSTDRSTGEHSVDE